MAQSGTQLSRGALLTLEIWRPSYWPLEVTAEVPASLLAHTVTNTGGNSGTGRTDRVQGHFTVYGDSTGAIDQLVETASQSRLTHSVVEMKRQHDVDTLGTSLGSMTRELFVEYDTEHMINEALISEGFLREAPVQISEGMECWSVFVDEEDRVRLQERLDRVRELEDVKITVSKISSDADVGNDIYGRTALLTERQREIFELACTHNYYAWPREITTRELADKAGITKTTLLEHLRTAESKLLTPVGDGECRSL